MEQSKSNVAPQEETPEETLGRRQLLKAIAATGGAAAASTLLPGKWVKPVVEVGLLPAHAQVSPTPNPTATTTVQPTATATVQPTAEPVVYTIFCDSTPGGGDITLGGPPGTGNIFNISATIVLLSGTGPIAGIQVTMTPISVPPSSPLPTFNPPLPRTANTDGSGVASFGDLAVNGSPGQSFNLRFDFVDSINGTPYSVLCGQYDLP